MLSDPRAMIRNAQKGCPDSIELLVHEFSEVIQQESFKYGLLQHPDWSHSDLSQEVLIHVLAQIGQFRGVDEDDPVSVFEQWIRVTTRNFLSNLQRRRNAKKRFPDTGMETIDGSSQRYNELQDPAKTASSIFSNKEEFGRLQDVIRERLDETQQEILTRRVEGLTLAEISEQMGITFDQVRYRYEKALAEVKRYFE